MIQNNSDNKILAYGATGVLLVLILFFFITKLNIGNQKDNIDNNIMQTLGTSDLNNSVGSEDVIVITSNAFRISEQIPVKYTCDGDNVLPPLTIGEVPLQTKSLAIIVDDPDAPMKTWTHFLAWNIDAGKKNIPENDPLSGSVKGTNDFNILDYRGPCPSSGTHRYYFKIYALDALLELKEGAGVKELEEIMKDHILAKGQIVGIYTKF